jgi:hypothetical protein
MTAHAQWKYSGSSDNFDSYIDYSRIKTEGRYKSIWTLTDFKSPQTFQSKQYKSSIRKNLIDCQASRSQTVARFDYPEQMGSGAVVFSANYQLLESDWEYFPPNSVGDGFINIACGRK